MTEPVVQKGLVEEAWPEVYTKPRPFDEKLSKRRGALNEEQLRQFWEEGLVVLHDYFDIDTELEPCRRAVEEEVDRLADDLYGAGKIKDLYKDQGLFQRLISIDKDFPGASVILHKAGILKEPFKKLWSNEKLLNIMEQLIGPNISGHPVWNLRTKCPKVAETVVPWHQDNAYTDNNSYRVLIPTAWIPLLDANEQNGCMEFARRGHRTGKIGRHTCCAGPTWYVMMEPEEMEKTLDVDLKKDLEVIPVPYGSFVLFNNAIPHRSLDNLSDIVRWSLDLRWQATDTPDNFYGLKPKVEMRREGVPDLKIDWSALGGTCRDLSGDSDRFSTTISGPWMLKWEITDHNKHSAGVSADKVNWHKN